MRSVLHRVPDGASAAAADTVPVGVAAIALCLCLLSCARPRLTPTPADTAWAAVQWPGTTDEDLASGYATYRRRCAGCHHLPLPAAYAPEKWPRVMREMTVKARLTEKEHDLILHYVLSVQAREEPGASGARREQGASSSGATPDGR